MKNCEWLRLLTLGMDNSGGLTLSLSRFLCPSSCQSLPSPGLRFHVSLPHSPTGASRGHDPSNYLPSNPCLRFRFRFALDTVRELHTLPHSVAWNLDTGVHMCASHLHFLATAPLRVTGPRPETALSRPPSGPSARGWNEGLGRVRRRGTAECEGGCA